MPNTFYMDKKDFFLIKLMIIVSAFIFIINNGLIPLDPVLGSEIRTDPINNPSELFSNSDYPLIPSNITINVPPKESGTLYLSAIISNDAIHFTRNLNDELFPFQLINWYPLIQFSPNFDNISASNDLTIDSLIVGQLQDYDEFDHLLEQARIYYDVPFNKTVILDIPNKDVSFMQLQVNFSNGDTGIYYGLYDGNQQTDKSEINLLLNPQSSLKILEFVSAKDLLTSESLLYNVTHTLVCNDLYKLGYEKCM